ncbi:hypothetical protein SAMN02745181_1233 [Rubritalea squalenifaciens DSM 18772]|uniref:Uncharacterized protein n=1 Tax=Rubritalea squalenifaciens DSM 18772 TaxID=1123071 RepID=A0A1M6GQM4_9BACT|nr:hypothetical protein [Rubritalea squalenifaciens]SHJ12192.1 hypothetical protein SAMN02745181_1233 [Rubritalea squalenifaciens DSM 18772]
MKITFFVAIIAIVIASTLNAEEGWRFQVNSDDKPSMVYELADGKKISFMSYYIRFDTISDEVALQFQKDYPKLWKEAQNSSGNMHNPKILPLANKFSEVLLKTATVQRLNKMASDSGYTISGAEYEKFHFEKEDGKQKVFAIIWLTITKQTEQGAVPKP